MRAHHVPGDMVVQVLIDDMYVAFCSNSDYALFFGIIASPPWRMLRSWPTRQQTMCLSICVGGVRMQTETLQLHPWARSLIWADVRFLMESRFWRKLLVDRVDRLGLFGLTGRGGSGLQMSTLLIGIGLSTEDALWRWFVRDTGPSPGHAWPIV